MVRFFRCIFSLVIQSYSFLLAENVTNKGGRRGLEEARARRPGGPGLILAYSFFNFLQKNCEVRRLANDFAEVLETHSETWKCSLTEIGKER